MPSLSRPAGIAAVSAVMLAAMAACTASPPSPGAAAAPATAASTALETKAQPKAPATTPTPPAATAAVTPEPAPPSPAPSVLLGLTGAGVTRLMGAPRFRRAEDPSALWQYAAAGCILDLYLRSDGGDYRVVHYEFRRDPKTAHAGTAAAGVDAQACFATLARQHGASRG